MMARCESQLETRPTGVCSQTESFAKRILSCSARLCSQMRPAFPPPRRSWLTARRTATLDNEYSDDDGIDEISDRRSEEPRPRRASMCRASSFIQPLPKQQSSAPHRLARDSERYYSTEHFRDKLDAARKQQGAG